MRINYINIKIKKQSREFIRLLDVIIFYPFVKGIIFFCFEILIFINFLFPKLTININELSNFAISLYSYFENESFFDEIKLL